tara:strand:- start:11 stop:265 length:255 start_codon:yes stop_codon:yes gene_type:complete
MIWNFDLKDSYAFIKGFADFNDVYTKKVPPIGVYEIVMPIINQTDAYFHFVWVGTPDIASALSFTNTMNNDPSFLEYSKKMASV